MADWPTMVACSAVELVEACSAVELVEACSRRHVRRRFVGGVEVVHPTTIQRNQFGSVNDDSDDNEAQFVTHDGVMTQT